MFRDSPSTLKPASAVHLPMEGAEVSFRKSNFSKISNLKEMAIISLRCLSARIGVRRVGLKFVESVSPSNNF